LTRARSEYCHAALCGQPWRLDGAGTSFTTFQELGGDMSLVIGYSVGASLNGIITLQILIGNAGRSRPNTSPHKKTSSKTKKRD